MLLALLAVTASPGDTPERVMNTSPNIEDIPLQNKQLNNKKCNCSATTFPSSVNGVPHEDSRKTNYEKAETNTSEERDTPIISHVTSMNQNAFHLNIGSVKFAEQLQITCVTNATKNFIVLFRVT